MSSTVFGLVPGPSRAKRIADDLRAAGFSREAVSVVIPDRFGAREFAFDWHVDLRALPIKGMGSFLAMGPLSGLLRGGASGIVRALENLGLSEFDSTQVEGKLKAGSSLVAVHVDEREEVVRAQEICERHRAEHIYVAEVSNAEPAQ